MSTQARKATDALTAVLLACGCAGVQPARPPVEPVPDTAPAPPPPRELADSEVTAIAELLTLEDRRTADTARLAHIARHESSELRSRAALAAGRIGDRSALPLLLNALRDSSIFVAASAAFALGELGDTSSAVVASLAALLARPGTENDPRAVEAAGALGKLATPAAFAAIRDRLASHAADARRAGEATKEALLAVWRFPAARAVIDLIVPHLKHSDVELRWRATYALMRTASPAALRSLLPRLDDPDPLVRSLAVRALRAPAVDSAALRETATAALRRALADPHPHVRINALGAIGSYNDSTLAPDLLPLLDDPDDNVRIAAASALGSVPSAMAGVRLGALVEDGSAPLGLRAAALNTLARLDAQQAVNEAARWARSPAWLERLLAARALSSVSWSRARHVLRELVSDDDARVARAALANITRMADTTSTAYALYVQSLKSADPEVRAAAIAGIGRRASPADLTTLMDAYEHAQSDSIDDAALAAVDALAALARAGLPVENAFFLRFPPHPDPAVRRRVAQRFGAEAASPWADTAIARIDKPLAYYSDIVQRYVRPALAGRPRPRLEIGTSRGTITIELAAGDAPLTVHHIVTLVETGFYDARGGAGSRRWHRVVPNFVLQDGDPRGDGSGGPGYRIRDEINLHRYGRGVVGMALSGPDTGGSQFFITHSPQPHLDGGYTIFGHVVHGLDVADRIVQDDPITFMRIIRS